MKKVLVTNNPLVKAKLSGVVDVEYHELEYLELMTVIRDKVHQGAVLLTHPLAGSVKPGETPYRTVMLDDKTGPVDYDSLQQVEAAIRTTKKFMAHQNRKARNLNDQMKEDFQVIDLSLIMSALPSAGIQLGI